MQGKAEETVQAQEAQTDSGLEGRTFALYWVLKGSGVPDAETKAAEVNRVLSGFPDWPYNDNTERKVRMSLYKALMNAVGRDAARLKETVDHLLRMHRTMNE